MNKNTFSKYAFALAGVLFLSAKTAHAVVGELQPGDLLTAPLMISTLTQSPNMVILLDNAPSADFETAWTSTANVPSVASANVVVGSLTPVILSGATKVAAPTMSYENNLTVAVHRSHYTNPLYYNPQWTYLPWNNDTYVSYYQVYPATAAPVNVMSSTSATVDLTQDFTYDTTKPSWTGQSITPSVPNAWSSLSPTPLTATFKIPTYFEYTGPQVDITNPVPLQNSLTLSNFTRVVISPATATYTRAGAQRTDCAQVTVCTYAEEIQNFTNWFVYHRNRLNTQKGIASWALSRLGEKYRIGLALTNKGPSTIDGLSMRYLILGVRPFSGTDRTMLMLRLNGVNTSYPPYVAGNAKLRSSLFTLSAYFSNNTSSGPNVLNPSVGGAISSCRENEVMLLTNGNYAGETVSYTSTSEYALGATQNGTSNVTIEALVAPNTVTTQNVVNYGAHTTQFLSNYGSPTFMLADITHALYWSDLLPSTPDASRFAISRLWGSIPTTTFASTAGLVAQHLDDPVSSQNMKTSVVATGMPGLIAYDSNLIKDPRYGSTSVTMSNNNLTQAWYFTAGGTNPPVAPSNDRAFSDDLLRAGYTGHGDFIPLHSRDEPFRLDPKVQFLNTLLKASKRVTDTGSQAEAAVIEDYKLQGVSQPGYYGVTYPANNDLEEGNVQAFNSGYLLNASYLASQTGITQTNPPWKDFVANESLKYLVNNKIRNVVAPTITASNSPITSRFKLNANGLGTDASLSNLTAYMTSHLTPNRYGLELEHVYGIKEFTAKDNGLFANMKDKPFRYRRIGNGPYAGGSMGGVPDRILGPVFNSHLVAIQQQDYGYGLANNTLSATYNTYLQTKKASPIRVAFGANDGMFHVFNGNTFDSATSGSTAYNGWEELAYIPAGVWPSLKSTTNQFSAKHVKGINLADPSLGFRYTVDGPASTGDVHNGSVWKSIVTGSLGNGGKGLFAIDVTPGSPGSIYTDTSGPNGTTSAILWDKTISGQWSGADWADVGYIRNRSGIFKMPNGSYAVIVGNGAKSDNGRSVLFILNALTGSVIRKITTTSSSTSNGLMGLAFLFNANREVITIYGGDLQGNLWKFDTSATSATSWALGNGGLPLYTATNTAGQVQAITAKPVIYPNPDVSGNIIIFGTGSNFRYLDENLTRQHSIYGVFEPTPVAGSAIGTITKSQLAQQTLYGLTVPGSTLDFRAVTSNLVNYTSNPMAGPTRYGWYIDLPMTSTGFATPTTEAITGDLKIVGTRLVFASATPPSAQLSDTTCDLTNVIKSAVTSINPVTGGALNYTVYDTNGDGNIDALDNAAATGYVSYSSATPMVKLNFNTNYSNTNANLNAAGTPPFQIRTGTGFTIVNDGRILSSSKDSALRSWRQLIPR